VLVRKWEDSNAGVRRVVISCVSACLCTVWCVVCGLCCARARAQGTVMMVARVFFPPVVLISLSPARWALIPSTSP
jgi:hypothetical protein